MDILSELLYPTRWYMKIITTILVVSVFTVLATGSIAGFLIYRIVKPQRTSSEINMASFPGRPDTLEFDVPGLGRREGWFFPGLRGAPTIILCHGYQSSRGELLMLLSALQDHQYNVFVFDFAAHGKSAGITSLGFHEAGEVRAAVAALAQRNDVDPGRFGLWGYNMGAYAALRVALDDRRIRTLVLDSAYDRPDQMLTLQIQKTGLGGFPLMVRSARFMFRWLNLDNSKAQPLSKQLPRLAGVPKLFIQAVDEPELARTTQDLFLAAPEPRDQAIIPRGNFAGMGDDDKRDYENRVVSYFLLRLPVTAPLAPAPITVPAAH
ncbi:MAG: alpha/beta hydrolase [Acidobacteriia bacterium]|nr:alpha/beta hydrolase [Terriglobia bacterium]